MLPIDGELSEVECVFCVSLPGHIRAGGSNQGDTLGLGFHQEMGIDISRIDKMLTRYQALVHQCLVNCLSTIHFMDGCRRRHHLSDQMARVILTRFT